DIWIEAACTEASHIIPRELLEKIRGQLIHFRLPPLVTRESLAGAVGIAGSRKFSPIAPAGRFPHQRIMDDRARREQSGDVVAGCERATVEKMFLNAVAKLPAKLRPGSQLRVNACWAVDFPGAGANVDAIATHQSVKREFLIPDRADEFRGGQAIGRTTVRHAPIV